MHNNSYYKLKVFYLLCRLMVSPEDLYQCPGAREIWQQLISPYCIRRDAICDVNAKYRTIDGSCNNLQRPLWGRSNRPHRRLIKPMYMDGVYIGRFFPTMFKINKIIVEVDVQRAPV